MRVLESTQQASSNLGGRNSRKSWDRARPAAAWFGATLHLQEPPAGSPPALSACASHATQRWGPNNLHCHHQRLDGACHAGWTRNSSAGHKRGKTQVPAARAAALDAGPHPTTLASSAACGAFRLPARCHLLLKLDPNVTTACSQQKMPTVPPALKHVLPDSNFPHLPATCPHAPSAPAAVASGAESCLLQASQAMEGHASEQPPRGAWVGGPEAACHAAAEGV